MQAAEAEWRHVIWLVKTSEEQSQNPHSFVKRVTMWLAQKLVVNFPPDSSPPKDLFAVT